MTRVDVAAMTFLAAVARGVCVRLRKTYMQHSLTHGRFRYHFHKIMSKSGRRTQTKVEPNPTTRYIILAVIALLVVGGIALIVSQSGSGGGQGIEGLQNFGSPQAGIHRQGKLGYPNTPPIGGAHNPSWQTCGIYNQPVENEYAVHSLEHGAAWIAYDPALNPDAVNTLKALVRGRSYTLLAPYPGIPQPIVASAWGYQLSVTEANDPRLLQFITRFANGPQAPEPGASCSSGNGQPDER